MVVFELVRKINLIYFTALFIIRYSTNDIICRTHIPSFGNILETTLSGCVVFSRHGVVFWTAGQRIDPSRESTFVWRVTSTNTYSDTVSAFTYTNWHSPDPNYAGQNEACMHISTADSYKWHDNMCSRAFCSVCEIDIIRQ